MNFLFIAKILMSLSGALVALKQVGVQIPPALQSAVANLQSLLLSFSSLTPPPNSETVIAQVEADLKTLGLLSPGTLLADAAATIAGYPSIHANLESGQLAIVAEYPQSFDGTPDTVVIAAFRKSGTFSSSLGSGPIDPGSEAPAS